MKIIILTGLLIFSGMAFAQTKADDIVGIYWTAEKQGKIEIYQKGTTYFGKILWRKEARKDIENPDRSLRSRSVVGIEFLRNFKFDGDDEWVSGEVYSIDNGGTYSGKMWLTDSGKTLKMRGYMGISLLGRTVTLTRAE